MESKDDELEDYQGEKPPKPAQPNFAPPPGPPPAPPPSPPSPPKVDE